MKYFPEIFRAVFASIRYKKEFLWEIYICVLCSRPRNNSGWFRWIWSGIELVIPNCSVRFDRIRFVWFPHGELYIQQWQKADLFYHTPPYRNVAYDRFEPMIFHYPYDRQETLFPVRESGQNVVEPILLESERRIVYASHRKWNVFRLRFLYGKCIWEDLEWSFVSISFARPGKIR